MLQDVPDVRAMLWNLPLYTTLETVHTPRIATFPLDVQAAYHLVVQHVGALLQRAGIAYTPSPNNGSYTFLVQPKELALARVVPWDSRTAGLSDMEPASHWGISIWLQNQCLSAENMQALWSCLEGFYCPSPPYPLLAAAPNYETSYQAIRFCLDDSAIDFLSLPGADLDLIPTELRFAAEDFRSGFFPFSPTAWETIITVLRDMVRREPDVVEPAEEI